MNIKIDRREFEKGQNALIGLIASAVRPRLADMGLGEDQELVEGLVFDIGAILEGSEGIEIEGRELRPFLTFAEDRRGEQLVATEGGSWIHEICSGVIEKIYSDEPAA